MSHFRSLHLAPHCDAHERKIFLGPGPVEFHLVRLTDFAGAHITHHSDDFGRRRQTRHEEGFPDWIFVPENLARASLADQHHVSPTGDVMFVEIASGEKWNAPGA